MKVNQLRWGSILSYLQIFIGIILGVVYTPVMIRLLGQSEYGLYNTVSSTVGLLSVLNLGLGSGYIRYHAKYKKENDYEKIYNLNGLYLSVFLIISAIAFCGGLFLTFNLNYIFDVGLTESEYETARVLMILLTVNLVVSFLASVVANIIIANERYIFNKVLGMIKTVVAPLMNIPLLLLGYKSIAMVSLTLALTILVETVQLIYVLKVLKYKFKFGKLEKGIFAGIFSYTIFITINIIVDQINWNIDKVLLGRFKGTVAVALYAVGYSLYHHFMTFSTAVSGLFTPRIHNTVAQTENDPNAQREKLTELFVKVGRMQFLLLGLIASGFIFFGKQFIVFWIGNGYDDSYYVALLLILPSIVSFSQNLGIEIQRAKNVHRYSSIIRGIMAIANLLISIYLCQIYGVIGCTIGTTISIVLFNIIFMNVFYHKKCSINIIAYWKNITRILLGLIIPIIVGVLIVYFVDLTNLLWFVLAILGYSVIYLISQWFISMNSFEKQIITSPLKKIFKKK